MIPSVTWLTRCVQAARRPWWIAAVALVLGSAIALADSTSVQPASYARATFGIRLAPALDRIEHDLPLRIEPALSKGPPPGFEMRLEGEREPLKTTLRHDTMFVQCRYNYWLTARGRDFGTLECGSSSDPRRADFTCMAVIGWGDDWELDALVTPFPVVHDKNCKPEGEEEREKEERSYGREAEREPHEPEIKILAYVNARIESTLVQPLARELREGLRDQARLRNRATSVWEAFLPPFEIGTGSGHWLDYDPQRLLARPLVFAGDSIRVDLALEMLPVFYTARPEPSQRPLPEVRVRLSGDNFEVAFDCGVWLDSLASRVRELCASRFPSLGVREVVMGGNGDRVTLELQTGGRNPRTLRFAGRATCDPRANQIQVTDLAYSPDAGRSGGAAPGNLQAIRRAIQEVLREDISEQIAGAVEPLGYAMNRPVNGEVRMAGGINRRRLLGVAVENGAVVAHWVAGGRAWLYLR
jgi:hypothetical protein